MAIHSNVDRLLVLLGTCLVIATGAVLILADKRESAATSATGPVKADRVVISNFMFAPETVQVKVGSKVTFVNNDSASHTATDSATHAFDTGILKKGDTKVVTLTKVGDIAYICELHPFMKATIKVVG